MRYKESDDISKFSDDLLLIDPEDDLQFFEICPKNNCNNKKKDLRNCNY